MKKNYIQPKMVNWYQPRMLLNIGLKAMISGTFGNYADRREVEAALDSNADNKRELENLKAEYCKEDNIWIDVINDTGDGFNSTFAVAKTVAQTALPLKYRDESGNIQSVDTSRGKILVFGGDEVYPFPTLEEYTNRFKIPYASACDNPEELNKTENRPHLYAIPGNHDWYDGLGNFIKLFCQQRWIGIWSTKQHRSYFALPLPNDYWIWATDIQLNSDIDAPQLIYFETIARNEMPANATIILITAEPAWVYKQIHKDDRSFDKLQFFIDKYIHNKTGCTGKNFKHAATLTGDLHHYARYCHKDKLQGHQYITAGGGGSFLHLTHNLPLVLKAINKKDIERQQIFPGMKEARGMLVGNFLFPFKNFMFTFLLFCIYLLYAWIIRNQEAQNHNTANDVFTGAWSFFRYIYATILQSPPLTIITLALSAGFYAFTDTNVLSKAAKGAGILHSLVQTAVLFATMYCISRYIFHDASAPDTLIKRFLAVLACCFLGSIVAGFFMGTYLYYTNLLFGMHINEASSSLASPDYKNFLRLHVHAGGVTVYPVGIRKVPRNWKQQYNEKEATLSFTGNTIEAFLIEKPIQILNDQL